MKLKLIIAILITNLFVAFDSYADGGLDGYWQAISLFEDGRSVPTNHISAYRLTIIGNQYLLTMGDVVIEMKMRVNNDSVPRKLDLMPLTGVNKGKWFKGIYELNRNVLTIAYGEENADAPGKVETSRGRVMRWRKIAGKRRVTFVNSLGMKFRLIQPATFIKGAEPYEPSRQDETQTRVTITKPYYIGVHEVTVGQFAKYVKAQGVRGLTDAENGTNGAKGGMTVLKDGYNRWDYNASWRNPGFKQSDRHPVVFISWQDAVNFTKWLSKVENRRYRLPTEAEWEYACRAKTRTVYSWGDIPEGGKGYANLADQSWAKKYPNRNVRIRFNDGYVYTSPVGTFRPNSFGLYDMHGNVFEWVQDYWSVPQSASAIDPVGPATGTMRIAKGGAFGNRSDHVRAAFRFREEPRMRHSGTGFRVALDAE